MITWQNKRVLITGGLGFIGRRLIRKLVSNKAEVIILDNNKKERDDVDIDFGVADILDIDISQPFDLEHHDISIIFHLAALTNLKECTKNPLKAFEINCLGTQNLLESIRSSRIERFIYMSTLGVYGIPKNLPMDEDHPTIPIEPYAASKLAGESVTMAYSNSYGVEASIARSFNAYGPGQRNDFIIPRIIEQGLEKDIIELENIKSTRDFIWVDDVAEGLIKIAEKGKDTLYNLGTGIETPVEEVIKIVGELLGKKIAIKTKSIKKSGVLRSRADIEKAKTHLGWRPKVNLREGLSQMINYYREATIDEKKTSASQRD